MVAAGEVGSFWFPGKPDRQCEGRLGEDGSQWVLTVDKEHLLERSAEPLPQPDGSVAWRVAPTPADDVSASAPRVIWGQLVDGTQVSLLDAQLVVSFPWPAWIASQTFRGWRVVRGLHVDGLDVPCDGVRLALPRPVTVEPADAAVAGAAGELSVWGVGHRSGLEIVCESPATLRELAELLPNRLCALFTIACGIDVGPLRREVLIGTNWFQFGVDRPEPSSQETDLLPARVGLELLGQWIDLSSRLGVIPFVVRTQRSLLGAELFALAAGLEGLHRHLYVERHPFPTVTKKGRARARKAAVAAGVAQLAQEGWADEEFAKSRFSNALNHVGQMSYRERLRELLEPVAKIAPGLFGPSLDQWSRAMVDARNMEGHRLTSGDDESLMEEVGRYFVLAESAKWGLRIAILRHVVPSTEIAVAIQSSLTFRYSLANIDLENHWRDFSCVAAFEAEPAPSEEEL